MIGCSPIEAAARQLASAQLTNEDRSSTCDRLLSKTRRGRRVPPIMLMPEIYDDPGLSWAAFRRLDGLSCKELSNGRFDPCFLSFA